MGLRGKAATYFSSPLTRSKPPPATAAAPRVWGNKPGSRRNIITKRTYNKKTYNKKAGELDLEQGTAPGSTGPFRKELNEHGQKGRVIAPVVGAFAEISPDTYAIADLISSVLANEHCSFFADKPSEAKGMFTQRLFRSLGLAAQLGWVRLLVDRYRDLVEVPAPTHEGPRG